ncbi:hypothetical protein PV394_21890 [Streptomyces sp. NE06-03E]|uniref:hypothetical protein n=1 Tax=Streptomyces sp. NE06-03E TaxID=3028695 RepID=UPI0029B79F04|nr:hypothetical protein [Streptomyces sp. NE06-03E]MDX3057759.1 hypothetical protein [Streptomyces sp. NE06-03E]
METPKFDSPDDETNDEKTAYAFFGLALYMAAVMEKNVIGLLVPHRIARARAEGRVLTKDPYEQAAKAPLKENVRKITPFIISDQALADELLTAADRRNYLAHEFWAKHIEGIFADGPRRRLIAKLKNDIETFGALAHRVDVFSDAVLEKSFGATPAHTASLVQQSIAQARAAK